MASNELLDYIRQVKSQGFNDADIKSHLLAHGYTKEIVDEAFSQLNPPAAPVIETKVIPIKEIAAEKIKINKPKKKKIPIYFHIIVLLIVILLFLRIQLSTESSECESIKLDVHELNGKKIICSFPDNSKVQMILKNDGEKSIGFVKVYISDSEKKSLLSVIKSMFGLADKNEKIVENLELLPEDVSTNVVEYGLGKISTIRITPGIISNGKKKLCQSKEIIFNEIKSC